MSPSNLPFRTSCQAALPLGSQAANTVIARVAGADPAGVDVAMSAQCISLGRHAGTFQVNNIDDTPRRLYLGGRTGAFVKEYICRRTIKLLRGEAENPGSIKWHNGPDRTLQLAANDLVATTR